MLVRNDTLRWLGGSLVLVNLTMFLVWGWAAVFLLGLGFGCVLFAAGWWADEIDLTNELPLLVSLLGVVIMFSSYFVYVFANLEDITGGLQRFLGAVIALVIVEIIVHSLAAAQRAEGRYDERDKAIQRAASRWGYGVMAVGIWLVIGQLALGMIFQQAWINSYFSGYLLANVLFMVFIVSELVNITSRLLYYRRGLNVA
ncbi:MAG: hypothetical protein ACJ0Q8_09855 [Candidatus Azotimanducaceae bacterium]|jgi:hypothetical protein|tara:strand:- start:2010 stop:2609 length:600 start_codon:yes stop_codon:yes gene_type:complete